ncbi:hypothetical protein [Flexithrix dorotheae]|uniref:hypothetical protein n=1 Tax=Flexithrix dorotheae TaxID=70993 RepID=UPI000381ACDD|nr:hypothetical protein [Flexithrix dorotheae]
MCTLDELLNINCEKNAAGLSAFYYAVQKDVLSIPAAVDGKVTTDITMESGTNFKKLEFVKDEAARMNISTQGPSKGKSWTSGVEFMHPKLRAELLVAMDKINNTDMIGIAVDTNGKKWILGDLFDALEAVDPNEGSTGGKGGNDRNQMSISLKVVSSLDPPYEYEGEIPLTPAA